MKKSTLWKRSGISNWYSRINTRGRLLKKQFSNHSFVFRNICIRSYRIRVVGELKLEIAKPVKKKAKGKIVKPAKKKVKIFEMPLLDFFTIEFEFQKGIIEFADFRFDCLSRADLFAKIRSIISKLYERDELDRLYSGELGVLTLFYKRIGRITIKVYDDEVLSKNYINK